MKVLDIGSGAGDVSLILVRPGFRGNLQSSFPCAVVSLILAELVGPEGKVIGVDGNAEILETARVRAKEAGFANVEFLAGDARMLELSKEIVAICIMMPGDWPAGPLHMADPAAIP